MGKRGTSTKKSELQQAARRELAASPAATRQPHEHANGAPDWRKESLRACGISRADEAYGILSVMRRLGFIDYAQMIETSDAFNKAARAVGREEPEYEAC